MREIERGKLIYQGLKKTITFMNIFSIIVGVFFLCLIPWVWINIEGNINPLTWSNGEWILAILTGLVYVMIIVGTIAFLNNRTLEIYENGFVPDYRALKYTLKRRKVFIPWDNIVYMEYIEKENVLDPQHPVKGYKIYYKLDGKIWCQIIGNYRGITYLGRDYEAKVFGKLYEVYNKLKNEGKLLPEKPKNVQMTM